MDRRRFLGIRSSGRGSRELSCEALYMRVVDSRASGTTAELLARFESELAGVREVRLRDSAWLAREELKQALAPLLASFRARGGRVQLEPR